MYFKYIMKYIEFGIEPQFKIYKMSENVENKFYIGKTRQPLNDRMKGHRKCDNDDSTSADTHFSNIGWNNVTCQIIDVCNDEIELIQKEYDYIRKFSCDLMLNKQHKIKDAKYHSNFDTPILIGRWDDENKIFIMKNTE